MPDPGVARGGEDGNAERDAGEASCEHRRVPGHGHQDESGRIRGHSGQEPEAVCSAVDRSSDKKHRKTGEFGEAEQCAEVGDRGVQTPGQGCEEHVWHAQRHRGEHFGERGRCETCRQLAEQGQ